MDNAYSLLAHIREQTGLPWTELRILLCHITGWSNTQLITRDKETLEAGVAERFSELAQRRLKGEPIAYLTGQREFFGRMFKVNSGTLIPRPETEELVERALNRFPDKAGFGVLDIGTGSGVIAITLKKERPQWQVHASDISQTALDAAITNAHWLDADIAFGRSDYFTHLPQGMLWDLIISNPPYIAAGDKHLLAGDLRFEPRNALTDDQDGLHAYRTLAGQGRQWLRPQGTLMMEHGFEQQQAIMALFERSGWVNIEGYTDLSGNPRIVSAVSP